MKKTVLDYAIDMYNMAKDKLTKETEYTDPIPKDVTFSVTDPVTGKVTTNTVPNIAKQNELRGVVYGGLHKVASLDEVRTIFGNCYGKAIVGGDLIIELPAGNFNMTGELYVLDTIAGRTKNRLIFRGAGKNKTIIRTNSNAYILTVNNANMTLENMTFEGNGITGYGLKIINRSTVIMTKNSFKLSNFPVTALYLQDVSRVGGDGLEITGSRDSIGINDSSAWVPNMTITGSANPTDPAGTAIYAINSTLTCNGSVIDGVHTMIDGISSLYRSKVQCHNVTITNVTNKALTVKNAEAIGDNMIIKGCGTYAPEGISVLITYNSYASLANANIDGRRCVYVNNNSSLDIINCTLTSSFTALTSYNGGFISASGILTNTNANPAKPAIISSINSIANFKGTVDGFQSLGFTRGSSRLYFYPGSILKRMRYTSPDSIVHNNYVAVLGSSTLECNGNNITSNVPAGTSTVDGHVYA